MHAGHRKVGLDHLLGKPIHLAASIAEDDSLRDGQGVIQVAQSIEFPLLALHGHEELLDALERQLITAPV